MTLADVLARGRQAAESRMGAENGGSTVTIRRRTGQMTTNTRGLEVPEWEDVHVDLPARLSGTAANSAPYSTQNIAGVEFTMPSRVLHLPAATTDLADDDYAEITAGENAGVVVRIIEVGWQDQATARRLPVVGVDRPEEWAD